MFGSGRNIYFTKRDSGVWGPIGSAQVKLQAYRGHLIQQRGARALASE